VLERTIRVANLHHCYILASITHVAPNENVMHHLGMRTTIKIDDDVHEFASCYASAKGITLSEAMNELVRKAESCPDPEPQIVYSPEGFPMFPPAEGRITSEMVKKLEEEEFDPRKFA
jgi:hypothetical protein